MGHGQDIASSQKLAHLFEAIELFFDDLMEQAGRQPERGDFMLLNHFTQLGERRRTRRKNHEPPPVQQRPPDFQRRGVKRHRRELEKHVAGIEAGEIGSLDQSHHAAMCHTNTFGPAGGARSVAHIRQVVRPYFL